ncbi:MAG TPA: metal-dependent hydrolase [Moraxellaceae bacterium]|nr:metal-dependent hydrolase [Moraxellaceae bacterium]
MTAVRHQLKARRVQFNLDNTPLHWLPDDPFATHMINGIHLLLPAGELWFCRVYNQALPYVTDAQLRADVEGFIRQEAVHSRVHSKAEQYLVQHGLQTDEIREKSEWLFGHMLGDAPFGLGFLKNRLLEKQWLVIRVGLVAAVEHFTGMLGQWAMDNKSWDKADPVMADLFRWHLAEEVEHRTVAFDLFEHLCKTQLGFYVSRQALMAIVFPLFLHFLAMACRGLAGQDADREAQRVARQSLLGILAELQRAGRKTENVPTFTFLVAGTLRWLSPRFHPVTEGNTEQALDYIARSPAARAAAAQTMH